MKRRSIKIKNNLYNFDNIYIEEKFKSNSNVNKILSKITSRFKINYINDITKLMKEIPLSHPNETAKNLLLSGIRGEILRKCPGTNGHICCNYYVINLYIGCPINCSYCILQSYLNQPLTIINIDTEQIFDSLENTLKNNPNRIFRIGTGELGDSLVYDNLTDYSIDFINFFAKHKNAIFEFKTKTDNIENILKIDSPGNIVVGFSVNPQEVISKEEHFASSLKERLNAASKLINKRYKIALHFDPIINIQDFEISYMTLIDEIFTYITPNDIAWISLGTFRYTPDLKNCIEYNYPQSKILSDEFIVDQDKKFRYFKMIRGKLYSKIVNKLKEKDKNLLIYLCMESKEMWEKVLGFLPYEDDKMQLVFKTSLKC